MRVILISPLAPPSGGMATWTEQYLKDSKDCNEVYTINTAFIGRRALHKGKKLYFCAEIKRFFRIMLNYLITLVKKSVDVIHINSSCSKTGILRDAICVFWARKKHIVFQCHCNVEDQLKGSLAVKLGQYIFNTVDCVLVLNQSSLNYVKSVSRSNALLIPNAIDRNLISIDYTVRDSLRDVIFVGHVKPQKGINEIIEASRIEKDVIFHLVGPISDEILETEAPDNVIFYGKKEHAEVLDLMKKADAFLFPSYTEGFSMVMLEAMAVGLPIIATNVGSNAEMIEAKGGIIINPMSSEEIVQAIEKIQSKYVRKEMSAWNLKKVGNSYRDDKIFEQIQEVYHDVCI